MCITGGNSMVEKNLPEYDCEWSDTPLPPGFYPKVKLKPIILILKIICISYLIKKIIIDKFLKV